MKYFQFLNYLKSFKFLITFMKKIYEYIKHRTKHNIKEPVLNLK